MVADIRPVAGAAVSLMELSSIFFLNVFSCKPKAHILLFWLGQYLVTGVAVKLDAGRPWGSGSNQCWFDSLLTLFCLKSDVPYQILSLSRGSFSLFFFRVQ